MDIRKEFLNYFKGKDHLILPSSSLIPDNDPSVLLTTAGMQQFKPYYLGVKKPPYPRISSVQKCFRTSDIDNIGKTDKHLTFFEMLGNFAFADYFKKEAIEYALDFILNILKIPDEKLWVSVFGGQGNLPMDKEAENYWIQNGIKKERICRSGMKENFWGPAGDTGPCGPSTEIYYDFGPEMGCGKKDCNPNCGCNRFIEIWNLVFTQYNFNGKEFIDLPNKNIDTGMGLERICSVINGSNSVFKTELFKNIILKIEELSRKNRLVKDYYSEASRAQKIISDHSRAIYFLISDGVTPSNEGRGYILRRIIRRAIRYGRLIGIEDYFLNEIGKIIIRDYKDAYPELELKKDISFKIVDDEEKRFSKTLKEGTKVLMQNISDLKKKNENILKPKDAFRLYDTYGFPVELTAEILKENNLEIDNAKFNEYMKEHIEKSREKTKFDKKVNEYLDIYRNIKSDLDIEFTGYESNETKTLIKKILVTKNYSLELSEEIKEGQYGELIIEKTPFYPEKGGAIGDKGSIAKINAQEHFFEVTDTQEPFEGLIIHKGFVKKGILKTNDFVIAKVDYGFRKNVSRNHTGTHLLHWALRSILGNDVEQAGSFVSDERLRFDYKIFGKYYEDTTSKIEILVNKKILDNDILKIFETSREYAQEIGATALFEEKYGKFVRVVEIGNYSRELCGGVHVKRTGELGIFKIISDNGIGANLRRIEALTGINAFNYLTQKEKVLKDIASKLNVDVSELSVKIDYLKNELEEKTQNLNRLLISSAKSKIINKYERKKTDGFNLIYYDFSTFEFRDLLDIKLMSILSDEVKDYYCSKLFCVFANTINKNPLMVFSCSSDLNKMGIDCSKIAKEAAKIINGGGGGKPCFAQAGGSDASRISDAVDFSINTVKNFLKSKNENIVN